MGRAETLSAVREKYPQYADMDDNALGTALAAKYPEYADLAQPAAPQAPTPQPNALTRGYESVRSGIQRGADALLDWTPGARKAAGMPSPGEQIVGVLPKTITGGLAQTAVGIPGLGALGRILAAGGAGEVGGQLEGLSTGSGALQGAIPAAVGEGVGKVAGPVAGMLPGGKGAANAADARRIGKTIGEVSPPLAGARTAQDIRTLAEGKGRDALGAAHEQATKRIEGMLPGQGGTYLQPGQIPMAKGPRSFREAQDELAEVGARRFSKNPLERNYQGVDQRRYYGDLRRDIKTGLGAAGGPQAPKAFDAMQADYAAGSKTLDFLVKSKVMDRNGMLNVPRLQVLMNDPKWAAKLQQGLSPENFAKLEAALFRGAGRGEVDKMASGSGRPLDALMQLLRGQNTGANMWLPILKGAVGLPNLGSQYVGRHPLAVPDQARPLFDLLGLKTEEARQEVMR